MKNIFLLLLLITLSCGVLPAQFGYLDPTFDADGIALLDTADTEQFNAVALQPDGKVVAVGGYGTGIESYFLVARFNPDGSRDLSFNGFGYLIHDFEPGTDNFQVAYDVLVEPDGKIVVAGGAYYLGDNDMAVIRLMPDGSLDSSFSFDGAATIHFPYGSATQAGTCIARSSDGSFFVGGIHGESSSPSSFLIAKLDAFGFYDYTFGSLSLGRDTIPFVAGGHAEMWDLQVLADGRLVCAGSTTSDSTNTDVALAILSPSGMLDNTFSGDGKLTTNLFGESDACFGILQQTDGKLVAAGRSGSGTELAVLRYTLAGGLDASFDGDGIVTLNVDTLGGAETFRSVAQQTDGKLVLAGQTMGLPSSTLLARLQPDGSADATFGTGGLLVTDIGAASNAAWGLALQADHKIVACGRTGFDAYVARFITGLEVARVDPRINSPLNLYPNPVQDVATLEFHLPHSGNVDLLLTDLQGRILHTFGDGIALNAGAQSLKLNLPTGLASGEYLVVLVTGEGASAVRLLKE